MPGLRLFNDLERELTLRRVVAMAVVGLAVAVAVGIFISWTYAAVAGWAAACLTFTIWVWAVIGKLGPSDTRRHARREDPSHFESESLILAASLASLLAVGVLLVRSHDEKGAAQFILGAFALVSVALSWVLIHTLYTLRYAREYYGDPEGGIDFNNPDELPRYSDFAYLAFDLGMTFQVSDTSIRTSKLRSIILKHTLLSYVFGSVILASTVNLVAGLGS